MENSVDDDKMAYNQDLHFFSKVMLQPSSLKDLNWAVNSISHLPVPICCMIRNAVKHRRLTRKTIT